MSTPNVAIIGTGRVARRFLRDLNAFDVPATGFVTGSEARAAEFSHGCGLPGFTSPGGLLAAHPQTDTALVINANHQHRASTIEALSCNLHVFCEKPMAPTIGECEEMVRAAEGSRGSLQIHIEYIHTFTLAVILAAVAVSALWNVHGNFPGLGGPINYLPPAS